MSYIFGDGGCAVMATQAEVRAVRLAWWASATPVPGGRVKERHGLWLARTGPEKGRERRFRSRAEAEEWLR